MDNNENYQKLSNMSAGGNDGHALAEMAPPGHELIKKSPRTIVLIERSLPKRHRGDPGDLKRWIKANHYSGVPEESLQESQAYNTILPSQ